MSKIRVKKLESIGGPLEIVGNNIIFSGNVIVSGNISVNGSSGINGTSGTSGLNGVNGNNGLNGTSGTNGTSGITPEFDLSLKNSGGKNSLIQDSDNFSINLGDNSVSFGEGNVSNGFNSFATGKGNITGGLQYEFIKSETSNHLLILDNSIKNEFITGATKTIEIEETLNVGTKIVTKVEKTYQNTIGSVLTGCDKYVVRYNNNVPNFQLTLNYTDCVTGQQVSTSFSPPCITGAVYSHVNLFVGNNLVPRPQLNGQWTPRIDTVFFSNFNIPSQPFTSGFPGRPNLIEYFQIEFDGFITPPTSGLYQFRLCSDDGSIFTMPSISFAINNDGQHGMQCVTGNVSLIGGFVYPFTMSYYQGPRWVLGLTLEWIVPGTNTWEIVPTSAFGCGNDQLIICSTTLPTYTIPPLFTAFTEDINNSVDIILTGGCCDTEVITTAYTLTTITITDTFMVWAGYTSTGCTRYEVTNNSNRSATLSYSSCASGRRKNLSFTGRKFICARKNSISFRSPSWWQPGSFIPLFSVIARQPCCQEYYAGNYTGVLNGISGPLATFSGTGCVNGLLFTRELNPQIGSDGAIAPEIVCSRTPLVVPNSFLLSQTPIGRPGKIWYYENDVNTQCFANEGQLVTTARTITALTITYTASCVDSTLILSGDCVTYRFTNNNQTNSSTNNIFWTDCSGVLHSEILNGYQNYYDVCAIENSAYASNNITITEIFSGCCVYNENLYDFKIIHNFSGTCFIDFFTGGSSRFTNDGMRPYGSLLSHNGVFYGVTDLGGTLSNLGALGYGTIFSCDTTGNNYEVLHTFYQDNNGSQPYAGLYVASNGLLYGTCRYDPSNGIIFSFDLSNRVFTRLGSFRNSIDINNGNNIQLFQPYGSLLEPSTTPNILYGTTYASAAGGSALGQPPSAIFKYDINTNIIYHLHTFDKVMEGRGSFCQLIEVSPGILYGALSYDGPNNNGTIFKYVISNNSVTMMYSFPNSSMDGKNPTFYNFEFANGLLYGLTDAGGQYNAGTIFSIDPTAAPGLGFTTVYHFLGGTSTNGARSLEFACNGLLYGVSIRGGSYPGVGNVSTGTIFAYDLTNNVYHKIRDFSGFPNDPAMPYGNIITGPDNRLYGISAYGGNLDWHNVNSPAEGNGTIYSFTCPTCQESSNLINIHFYESTDSEINQKTLEANIAVSDYSGNLNYGKLLSIVTGTTTSGGTIENGEIYFYDLPENQPYSLLECDVNLPIDIESGLISSNYFGDSSFVSGIGNNARGTASHAMGINAFTNNTAEFAMSNGISQYSMLMVNGSTTGNTSSELFIDGISERLRLEKDTFMYLTIDATAIITSNTGKDFTGSGFVKKVGPSPVSVGFTGQTMVASLDNTNIQNFEGNLPLITVTVNYVNEDYNEFIFTANGNNVGMTFKWSVGVTIVKNKI